MGCCNDELLDSSSELLSNGSHQKQFASDPFVLDKVALPEARFRDTSNLIQKP